MPKTVGSTRGNLCAKKPSTFLFPGRLNSLSLIYPATCSQSTLALAWETAIAIIWTVLEAFSSMSPCNRPIFWRLLTGFHR
ncbi:uncharacterized protein A1O9_09504 [Exophiala aquamarina CBS 119918]|uniref:Uncharacterized protein n=1 Tax=Exophiala aquamarina CBS 119918 TaxID=1182545 RepID=A0A072P503_9EURO|nr:uncharacterized protein A1O9_09504 [Exophiala aquamarina CBS 119918]KEF54338.1 hypothetical protein A1O9_09504 [Exophiala aquamarina CBS 119918]